MAKKILQRYKEEILQVNQIEMKAWRIKRIWEEKEKHEREKQQVQEMKITNDLRSKELDEADKKLKFEQEELKQNNIKLGQERDLLNEKQNVYEKNVKIYK